MMPSEREPIEGAWQARIAELETRLEESEATLEAIRRGEVDALVVGRSPEEQRVYTLESADRPYRVLVEQMQEGAVTLSAEGVVLYCNRRLAEMLQARQERVIGRRLSEFVRPDDAARFAALLLEARHAVSRAELALDTAGRGPIPVYLSLSLMVDGGTTLICGVLTDLTEQKLHLRELADANTRLTEEIDERGRVEDALRQSQKMEAVGQLTGGLAHDFNNLLTGILGSLELMQARVAQGRFADIGRYVAAATGAANRAASLTHRLLAFSRRQTLDPMPTDANRLVSGMVELIGRTVGPGVRVETVLSAESWQTLCDPNQLENALLNLAINARDAMPEGGTLTIETGAITVEPRAARERDMAPGHYVLLIVTDTGIGMKPEVVARAFDPFFTTKPIGQGTGLGLSMIYGFAKQSGGQVRIRSTPGQGTSVRLYLPRLDDAPADHDQDCAPAMAAGASARETILVIDDEPTVRMLVTDVLTELGYEVLAAGDGPSGLSLLQSRPDIDLLVTDVGLPGGMNGRQVADAARCHRPGLKVLFITGYANTAAIGKDELEPGMQVMTKPFPINALAATIKTMLVSA